MKPIFQFYSENLASSSYFTKYSCSYSLDNLNGIEKQPASFTHRKQSEKIYYHDKTDKNVIFQCQIFMCTRLLSNLPREKTIKFQPKKKVQQNNNYIFAHIKTNNYVHENFAIEY